MKGQCGNCFQNKRLQSNPQGGAMVCAGCARKLAAEKAELESATPSRSAVSFSIENRDAR